MNNKHNRFSYHVRCDKCEVPHVTNCRTCLGFGLAVDAKAMTVGIIPASAAVFDEFFPNSTLSPRTRPMVCPECRGGLLNSKNRADHTPQDYVWQLIMIAGSIECALRQSKDAAYDYRAEGWYAKYVFGQMPWATPPQISVTLRVFRRAGIMLSTNKRGESRRWCLNRNYSGRLFPTDQLRRMLFPESPVNTTTT